jgi:hypothetical protein
VQNPYAGDIGDYGKLAILRSLAKDDLILGVIWYLNLLCDGKGNGRFITYEDLSKCDPELFEGIQVVAHGGRQMRDLEPLLPLGTVTYGEPLPYADRGCYAQTTRDMLLQRRMKWFSEAATRVRDASLVFLNPDNGLASSSVKQYYKRAVKYAFLSEVRSLLQRGQTVILYQHQQRRSLLEQIAETRKLFADDIEAAFAVSFHRQSVRTFFVFSAYASLGAVLLKRCKDFLRGPWGEQPSKRRIFVLHE